MLGRKQVYVDASVVGIHERGVRRNAFVGYVIEGDDCPPKGKKVEAWETHEAEEAAILFAIRELKNSLKRFTVLCDHKSAVLRANWMGEDRKKVKDDQILMDLWKELDANHSIRVRLFKSNPAHMAVNQFVKEFGSGS